MITDKQRDLAKKFMNMHHANKMFILANAWDAGSAYIFKKEGFEALGTTSQGMALSYGYADGQNMLFDDVVYCVESMTRRVDIPVSVDIERGFADNVSKVKTNALRLLEVGAVGFNIEDGRQDKTLDELPFFLEKIRALAALKKECNLDFVINARTCTYWHNIGDEEYKLKVALERGKAFKEAGADCIFYPGAVPIESIKTLVKEVDAPINILLTPATSDLEALREAGVRRLSIGSGPARSAYNHVIAMAEEMKEGETERILKHSFVYAEANTYFKK